MQKLTPLADTVEIRLPDRAFVLDGKFQADTADDLAWLLRHFADAIAERSYAMAMRNSTTGQQYIRLQHVENVAAEYGIELDVYWCWMKWMHEANQCT